MSTPSERMIRNTLKSNHNTERRRKIQIKFEILKKGETVLNVWENHIAVQKKSGEVEIYQFYLDEDGLPRLSENTILITHGNGSISAKADGSSVEITTFEEGLNELFNLWEQRPQRANLPLQEQGRTARSCIVDEIR